MNPEAWDAIIAAVEYAQAPVWAIVAVTIVWSARRRPNPASTAFAAAIVAIALTRIILRFQPYEPGMSLRPLQHVALVSFTLFPLLLLLSAERLDTRWRHVWPFAVALAAVTLALQPTVGTMPARGEVPEGTALLWSLGLVAGFVGVGSLATVRFLLLARGRSHLIRHRLVALGLGGAVLVLAMPASRLVEASDAPIPRLGIALVMLATPVLLGLGFEPPAFLRSAWRRRDTDALLDVASRIGAPDQDQELARHHLLHVARAVLGAHGLALVDERGRVIDVTGDVQDAEPTRLTLSGGELLVTHSPLAPWYADAERQLVRQIAIYADLALHIDTVEELRAAERTAREQLEITAATDPLTGLLNRRGLWLAAARALASAARDRRRISAVVVDLDRFKAVNDQLGHQTGDDVLVMVADHLRAVCRGGDIVARLGGDEFVVLAATEEPAVLCDRIQHDLDVALRERTGIDDVGASVGLAVVVVTPDTTLERVLAAADQVMYRRKERRRHHDPVRAVIVDDSDDARYLVTGQLQAIGIEVAGAFPGPDELLAAIPDLGALDLAIIDFRLVGASGIEVAEAVAAVAPGLRVLLYSSMLTPDVVAEASRHGLVCLDRSGDLPRTVTAIAGAA